MSISEREQRALASIEGDLANSGPELAAKLSIFARLAAGEEMPRRETVWRPVPTPIMRPPASPPWVRADPERPRVLRRRMTCWLLMIVLAVALLTLAFTFSHGAGKGVCTPSATVACQHAFTPGQSDMSNGP